MSFCEMCVRDIYILFLCGVSAVTKQYRKPDAKSFAPTAGLLGLYLGDVIMLKPYKGVNAEREVIFIIIESHSRYVYARALTKANSSQTAAAMESILEQNTTDTENGIIAPIEALHTDGGPEFWAKFRALINKLFFPHLGDPYVYNRHP